MNTKVWVSPRATKPCLKLHISWSLQCLWRNQHDKTRHNNPSSEAMTSCVLWCHFNRTLFVDRDIRKKIFTWCRANPSRGPASKSNVSYLLPFSSFPGNFPPHSPFLLKRLHLTGLCLLSQSELPFTPCCPLGIFAFLNPENAGCPPKPCSALSSSSVMCGPTRVCSLAISSPLWQVSCVCTNHSFKILLTCMQETGEIPQQHPT